MLEVAAEKGANAGEIGALEQLVFSAASEGVVDAIRYTATPAADSQSLGVAVEVDYTANGSTQTLTDTLTFRPGPDGRPTLLVESQNGTLMVPVN